MKAILILSLLMLVSSGNLIGQDEDIKAIRAYYTNLKEKIKAASTDENTDFYVVAIAENTLRKSMPGVGIYHGTTEKWYITNEENGNAGMDGVLVYKKSNFEISNRSEFAEHVFKDGNLIFSFFSTAGAEYRYYFKDDKLIKYLEKKGEGAEAYQFYEEEDWKYIIKRAFD